MEIAEHSSPITNDNYDMFPRINGKWLRSHCRKHGLYQTPYLNEVLYLQYQGFRRIEGLDDYTGVKSLWLDHNHFKTIGNGLSQMQQLTCLFLQNNSLSNLQGIEGLQNLVILDVSNNQLEDTKLLDLLPRLTTLYIGNNKLRDTCSIQSLQLCQSLNTLDLKNNKLHDGLSVIGVLKRIPQLRVLYLTGNPVVREIDPYRILLICHCASLTFLDNRPVRENDRACATAWLHGGYEAMEEEKIRNKDRELLEVLGHVQGVLRKYGNKNVKMEELTSERINEVRGADHTSIILEFPDENQVVSEDLRPSEFEGQCRDD